MQPAEREEFIRALNAFTYQQLVHIDAAVYTPEKIAAAFENSPFIESLVEAFETKFKEGKSGNPIPQSSDPICKAAANLVKWTLKTNFYAKSKKALAFRLDPSYLTLSSKFPEKPFGIFFVSGADFIAFQIRFKDLARGGLRTVMPQDDANYTRERGNVFAECYNLALTQQMKNKDIPEGGSKAVILMSDGARGRVDDNYLYEVQEAFIEAFLQIINCDSSGKLKCDGIIDFYGKEELIFLGPDENMKDPMLDRIADYSLKVGYKAGRSFISSKPNGGINHKVYGVTSLGVFTYMVETLKALGIDAMKKTFTLKITGGPDGDVAGNMLKLLYENCLNTAKVVAITDGSGTILDPNGLDLQELKKLFDKALPVANYPPNLLSNDGTLLARGQEMILYKKQSKEILSKEAADLMWTGALHQMGADLFVTGGGRPRTLNEKNWSDFLKNGNPTAKAIVEGANLYLTAEARHELEKLGTLIIKDSSTNKGGVICSSYEVLAGFVLSLDEFMANKDIYVSQVLTLIEKKARDEAQLLLNTQKEQGGLLTDISVKISARINLYKYRILDYLTPKTLNKSENDPLMAIFLSHCPQLLQDKYKQRLLTQVPDIYMKAIIAAHLAAEMVYQHGLAFDKTMEELFPSL